MGVTHECDFPPGVEKLPHLTRSRIPSAAASAEIDRLVSEQAGSLYDLDEELLATLNPDLILTQEQCDVCAVNEATVRRAALALSGQPAVESVNPTTLGEVLAMFGASVHCSTPTSLPSPWSRGSKRPLARSAPTGTSLDHKLPHACSCSSGSTLPFAPGTGIPRSLNCAGGIEALGLAGQKSRRCTWDEVASSEPDVIIVALCGFPLERAVEELATFNDRPEWRDLAAVRNGRVAVVDGSSYFSRPGPRLETSLRIAAAAIDPERCLDLAPPETHGWRFWPATR